MAKQDKTLEFRQVDYYNAAQERYAQAQEALEQQQYGLALMLAGVAAECMIRAQRESSRWESRHDLRKLAEEAGFYPVKNVNARAEVTGAVITLHVVWRNNYRYTSEAKLQTFLVRLERYELHEIKGKRGALHRAANEALAAARIIMIHGGKRWASVKR